MHAHVQLFVTPWTVAHQAPLSMGFSKQEYWSGLPFPPPGDPPNPGIKPHLLCLLQAGSFFTIVPPGKPPNKAMLLFKNTYHSSDGLFLKFHYHPPPIWTILVFSLTPWIYF